ncbi:MAG: class I SAM-dependent methyltransferase [Verrucomicrobiae bacterium]|nr:class I SAM-dependent methyltransferase [Verrucomicrobiae bacterium]
MNESEQVAGISAARAYEGLHVPAMFLEWAGPMLEVIALRPGERFLDVACGTGVLAREASARVGESGRVTGLDLDPGMLVVAAELAPAVIWKQGSAEALPFPEGSFDAVACQFGLMFFPDPVATLREMARVLAPGGRIGVAVWDRLEHSPVYPRIVDLLEKNAGPEAAEALRAPFGLGDREKLETLFAEAGFESVTVETRMGTAHFPSLRSLMEAELRGWLPVMGVVLEEARIRHILTEAEKALGDFVTADGAFVFDTSAHLVTAGYSI